MTGVKPEIVIVHGGWHTPNTYAKLTRLLENDGFKIHVPPLPTMSGELPPSADLYVDSDYIRDFVAELSDAGKMSIVLMHSYGGQVGTNALLGLGAIKRASEGKEGGVIELVYMTAFAMAEGSSMTAWVDSQGHSDLMPLAFDFQDNGFVFSRDPKTLVVGKDFLTEEEMDQYVGTFVPWASKSWSDEIRQCAWREIPVTYIQTLQDMTVPIDYQKKFCENLRAAGVRVHEIVIDTGHCPNVTASGEVAQALKNVAGKSA